jgi:hypothetical protein
LAQISGIFKKSNQITPTQDLRDKGEWTLNTISSKLFWADVEADFGLQGEHQEGAPD